MLIKSAIGVASNYSEEIKKILRHPITSDASILTVSNYVSLGLGFLKTIVVARVLGPEGYGLFALVIAYPSIIWSFLGIKSMSVTTRYIASYRASQQFEELRGICKLGYTLDFSVSILALLIVVLTCGWAARFFYHQPSLAWLMLLFATSFPFASFTGTSWAVLSSWRCFSWLAFFTVAEPVIELTLMTSLLLWGFGVLGVVLAATFSQFLIGLGMLVLASQVVSKVGEGSWWKSSLRNKKFMDRELIAFFGWNYLLVTLSGLLSQGPLMLLGRYRGVKEAGYFRIAMILMSGASCMENALARVAYPTISARWATGERQSLAKSLKKWTLQGGLPLGILLLMGIPLIPILIPWVLGHVYTPIIPAVQVMLAAVTLSTVFFWSNSFYYASGRMGLWTQGFFLYTLFIILGGYFIVNGWGFNGMALFWTFAKICFTIIMVYLYKRKMDIELL
jgi:O-antigen/teichoic acid export membrane protein